MKEKLSIAREKKVQEVEIIRKAIKTANSTVLFHYHGLNSNTMNKLRQQAATNDVSLVISKNNLVKIALGDLGLVDGGKGDMIVGPIACLFSNDNPFAAFSLLKQVKILLRKKNIFKFVFALFEGKVINTETQNDFINFGTISDLHCQLLRSIKYPLWKLTVALTMISEKMASGEQEKKLK